MRRALTVIALVVAATGCGDTADTSATTSPPATAAPTTLAPTSTTLPPTATTVAPTTTAAPTTTVPPTTTTAAPTTTTGVSASAELTAAGLGVAEFGDDAGEALTALNQAFGPPLADDGWLNALDFACRGTEVRFPQWDGVFVVLTDAATDYATGGTRHLAFWGAFPGSPIATPSGFVPGVTTFGDVEATVGPITPEFNDLFDLYVFTVDSGPEAGIEFEVEDPDDPSSVIVGMSAGAPDICGE